MVGIRVRAADEGIEAFYAVDKAVLQQEIQRPVDRWRRRALAFGPEDIKDFVSPEGFMAAPYQFQNPPPERRQPHAAFPAQGRRPIERAFQAMIMIVSDIQKGPAGPAVCIHLSHGSVTPIPKRL